MQLRYKGGPRAALFLLAGCCSLLAQPASLEVVSIKRNTSLSGFAANPPLKGGRLKYTNVTVKEMLSVAYPVDLLHMSGGPSWLDNEHYDVEATTTEQTVSEERYREMVRAMLADRFQLAVRYETQVQQIYALSPDKKGLKLKATPEGADRRVVSATHMESAGLTMPKLAEMLTFAVGREVVDKSASRVSSGSSSTTGRRMLRRTLTVCPPSSTLCRSNSDSGWNRSEDPCRFS